MRIQSLEIENFRNIEHKKFLFKESTTVVYGENSSGKSALLDAVNLIFLNVLQKSVGQSLVLQSKFYDSDVKVGALSSSLTGNIRIEGEYFNINLNRILKRKKDEGYSLNKNSIASDSFKLKYLEYEDENMPIFAGYNLDKLMTTIKVSNKIKTFNKISALENNGNLSLFPWIKTCIKNSDNINDKHELNKIKEVIYNYNGEIKNIDFKNDGKKIIVETIDKNIFFTQLSYSEKLQLVLVADIGRRLILANPSIFNPFLGKGVIVIDDVDIALDSYWQTMYLKNLTSIFPNIQFIIGTHNKEIFKINKNKANVIIL